MIDEFDDHYGTPYFDKNAELFVRFKGDLHHWHQDGKYQFVTFRLADSMPQQVLEDIARKKELFLRNYPQPWDKDTLVLYERTIGRAQEEYLDAGYGSCLLSGKANRDILAEALHFYDGKFYDLVAYVIMPNHVHLVLLMLGGYNVDEIVGRVKGYSARMINERQGSRGKVWQRELWDRMLRGSSHLYYCLRYIANNPRHLPAYSFSLFVDSSYAEDAK